MSRQVRARQASGSASSRGAAALLALVLVASLLPALEASHATGIPDADHDFWPDFVERMFGTDPDDADDRPMDPYGFVPIARDNDGDGWEDRVESWTGSDPEDKDSQPDLPNQDPSRDTDGDNWPDFVERVLGTNPTSQNDAPLGITDNDSDGVFNDEDNCPNTANTMQEDLDADLIGDVCDVDIDGDGVANGDDAFPYDPNDWEDFDGDGMGDNADPDDDGDGVPDDEDAFPYRYEETHDQDGDGLGDHEDPDRDGDGVNDDEDMYPNNPDYAYDSDLDSTPDKEDRCPGFPDGIDQDYDGEPDQCDDDRDGDGVPNDQDAYPDDYYRSQPGDQGFQPEEEEEEPGPIGEALNEANETAEPANKATAPVIKQVRAELNNTTGLVDITFILSEFEEDDESDAERYAIYRNDGEQVSEAPHNENQTEYRSQDRSHPEGDNITYTVVPIYNTTNGTVEGNGTTSPPEDFEEFPEEARREIDRCRFGGIDTDNDAICDAAEELLGTSPYTNDTDEDGIPDALELRLGTAGLGLAFDDLDGDPGTGGAGGESEPGDELGTASSDRTTGDAPGGIREAVTPPVVIGVLGLGTLLLAFAVVAIARGRYGTA